MRKAQRVPVWHTSQELEHETKTHEDIAGATKAPASPRGVKRSEQIEPCSTRGVTVEQARIILGRESDLRDDELERLLDQMYALAHISIDALAESHWLLPDSNTLLS